MSKNHSAVGPALGYAYQFDRAAYRFFEAGIDVLEIGFEDTDDVSLHFENGAEIQEQDKSTINSDNPLSDKSEALWKTLHIWADKISDESLIVEKTEFHLITNGLLSTGCLAERITNATDNDSVREICEELRQVIPLLRSDLIEFGKKVNDLSDDQLKKLVAKVFVFDNVDAKFGGDLNSLLSLKMFDFNTKVAIFDQMSGWVKRKIRELVENKKKPRIKLYEFEKELQGLYGKLAVARLSTMIEPFDGTVEQNEYKSHGFVQQLDWIQAEEEVIKDAIFNFLHAQSTRMKWASKNTVSESAILEYEKDLQERWKIAKRRAYRNPLYTTKELKGQECLDLTLEQDTFIHNEVMPKSISSGSFHALANFSNTKVPRIGWHPEFESILKGISKP